MKRNIKSDVKPMTAFLYAYDQYSFELSILVLTVCLGILFGSRVDASVVTPLKTAEVKKLNESGSLYKPCASGEIILHKTIGPICKMNGVY
jgi:hypothetical protein